MEGHQENSTDQSTLKKYIVRAGTVDSGKDYEFKIASLLFLRCVNHGYEDAWMVSNADGTGAFDDVILNIKTSKGDSASYMIQLKHSDKSKNITRQHFLAEKGDFSLPKYFKDIDNLYECISMKKQQLFEDLGRNIYFVLYTNRALYESEIVDDKTMVKTHKIMGKKSFLKKSLDKKLLFLNTDKTEENVFKVDTTKLPSNIDLSNEHNYGNVFLFANQVHIRHVEEQIEVELRNIIDPSRSTDINIASIATKFVHFVTKWAKGNLGGHFYLTKRDVVYKITDLVLSKFELNLRGQQLMSYDSEKKTIWNQLVSDITITIVDSGKLASNFLIQYISSEVSKYYAGCNKKFDDEETCSSNIDLKTCMLKIVGNNGKISLFTIYKCIWCMGKVALVLEVNNQQDYCHIVRVLKLSNYAYKIIVINKSKQPLKIDDDDIKRFETLQNLEEANRNAILFQTVTIQGRSNAILAHYLDEEMYQYVKCADILHILANEFSIGTELQPLHEYFIGRTIIKKYVKSEALQEISGEIFLICGHNIDLPIDQSKIFKAKDVDFEKLQKIPGIIQIEDKITNELLYKLQKTQRSIHCLSIYNKRYLEWKWSEGTTKSIETFLIELKYAVENEIRHIFDDTINIISDAPGMGKSFLMDLVAHKAPISKWVLRINLNGHQRYFDSDACKTSSTQASKHIQYFYNSDTSNSQLNDAIFHKLRQNKNIVLLLDGFDEISVSSKDGATNIAKSLSNEGYHIWLTTRPVMKQHLEKKLKTTAMTLRPFSIRDQKQFLQKYFAKINSDLVSEHSTILNEFVDHLIDAARKNLNDEDAEFTGIPLQTKLLADAFQIECRNCLSGIGNCFYKDLNLVHLYKNFIDKRMDIVCQKYGEPMRGIRPEYRKHQALFALKTVFPIDHVTYIKKELCQYNKADDSKLLLLQLEGVMTINEKFEVIFAHYTYAEYLAAEWLAENINHIDVTIRELVQNLIQERFTRNYKFVFSIFDRILSQNCELHTAIINKQITEAKKIIFTNNDSVNQIDKGRRSPLHIIALYGIQYPLPHQSNKLYDSSEEDLLELLAIINQVTNVEILHSKLDILNYSPLDYALANCSLTIAHQIYATLQPTSISAQLNLNFKKDYLIYCQRLKYKSLSVPLVRRYALKDLLLKNEDRKIKVRNYLANISFFDFPDNFKKLTMIQLIQFSTEDYKPQIVTGSDLHFEAAFGNRTTIHALLLRNIPINDPDLDGYTPLHYAVLHQNSDITKFLVRKQAAVNKQNRDGNTPLHLSFLNYNETIAKLLLYIKETDVNIQNKDGDTALHLASKIKFQRFTDLFKKNRFQSIVHLLYSQGAKLNQQNSHGETPLHHAVTNQSDDFAMYLLNTDADTNLLESNGNTPLHLATQRGNQKITELLIGKGASVNAANKNEETPIHFASSIGYEQIVNLLIASGASVNATNKNGDTPMHLALLHRHPEIAYVLLAKRGNVNAVNKDGNTVLHLALLCEYPYIAQSLIAKGAAVDVPNKDSITAIRLALLNRYTRTAELLIAKGASVNNLPSKRRLSVNEDSHTPLHLALLYRCPDIAKLLIDNGADLNAIDKDGDTSLHLALLLGHSEIAELLIANGAELNAMNQNGSNPLHSALVQGYPNIAQLLIAKGADIDTPNKDYLAPIHLALLNKYPEIAELLVSKGANVNSINRDGDMPVHLALVHGYRKIAVLLIAHGADVNAIDKDGNTPLHLAMQFGYSAVADLLIANGADKNALNLNGKVPIKLASKRSNKTTTIKKR